MKTETIKLYKDENGKIPYLITILAEIPTNTILCKTLTGLGATFGEIKAKRNSIIIEPNVSTIQSKLVNPKHANDNLIGVIEKVGVDEVKEYILNSKGKHYKFLVTPESFYKVKKAFEAGITPILCCGESLEQRELGVTMDWIRLQIKSDLAGITADQVKSMVIAYEPIWAIGTGKTATSDQAQEVCKGIRDLIAEIYDAPTAEAVRIQYGGSMNAGNAAELLAKPDIDGGLIGGASLKADFGKVVNA